MALGATATQMVGLSLRHALTVTAGGLAAGAVLAVLLNGVMSATLFGLVSIDATAIGVMTAAIGVTALAAGWLPARRAARLEPTTALRTK
jgi:ABC-type antimicrobial peptide transport system permease subunit